MSSLITMPTIKQTNSFNKMVEKVGNKESISMGSIMLESGYSKAVAKNPSKLTKSKGWKQLLTKIDDSKLLDRVYETALGKDNRSSLGAVDMIFKLKDRYPDRNLRIGRIDDMLNDLRE